MKNTASITAFIVALSAMTGIAVLSTACGDDDDNTTPPAGSTSGTTSSGSTSSSGDGGGSSSGSTSSSGGAISYDAQIAANCALTKKCAPNFYAAAYGTDDAACKTFNAHQTPAAGKTYPGTSAPTQASIDKCTTQLTGAACTGYLLAGSTGDCAGPTGTGAADAKCNFSGQCSGGLCKKAAAADNCGACASLPDTDCDAATFACATGKACNVGTKKCVTPLAADAVCTLAGDPCAAGLNCTGPLAGPYKCAAAKDIDGTCDSAANLNECRLGLTCTGGKCKEAEYAKLGEACTATKTCANSSCNGGTCVKFAASGEACDATGQAKPLCQAGLACTSGTCAAPTQPDVCQ